MTVVSSYSRFKSTGGHQDVGSVRSSMTSSRQKRPYVRANFKKHWSQAVTGIYPAAARDNAFNMCDPYDTMVSPETTQVRDTAYRKLMAKALPTAAALVNAAQGKQSWNMVAQRSGQLVRALRALRRGRLDQVAMELMTDPSAVKRRVTRKFAIQRPQDAWLELTFGWMPLIQDCYNAVDVLQTEFPTLPVRGSSRLAYASTADNGWGWKRNASRNVQCRLVADLVVTNPNLLLANQLGLLNPAAVAWDVIPFSFVVDWFLPVGKFISTFNDQAGISLRNSCTTVKHQCVNNEYDQSWSTGMATGVIRTVGPFTKPGFPTKLTTPQPSLWLAATSVALLLQVFGGKK